MPGTLSIEDGKESLPAPRITPYKYMKSTEVQNPRRGFITRTLVRYIHVYSYMYDYTYYAYTFNIIIHACSQVTYVYMENCTWDKMADLHVHVTAVSKLTNCSNVTYIYPRRACAARVTVLGLCVCMCECECLLVLIYHLAQLRVQQEILTASA